MVRLLSERRPPSRRHQSHTPSPQLPASRYSVTNTKRARKDTQEPRSCHPKCEAPTSYTNRSSTRLGHTVGTSAPRPIVFPLPKRPGRAGSPPSRWPNSTGSSTTAGPMTRTVSERTRRARRTARKRWNIRRGMTRAPGGRINLGRITVIRTHRNMTLPSPLRTMSRRRGPTRTSYHGRRR